MRRARPLSVGRLDARWLRRIGAALSLVVGVLATGAAAQLGYRLAVWLQDDDRQTSPAPGASPAGGPPALSPADRAALAATVAFVNELLEQDAVAWTGRLADLEYALPAAATLVEVRPETDTGRLRVSGLAPSAEVVERFVRALEARPGVAEVRLISQALDAAGVGFALAVVYRVEP